MCHDGLDFHGDNGGHGAALEGTGRGLLACDSLRRTKPRIFDIQLDGAEAPQCEALTQINGDPAEKSTTAKREQVGTMIEAHEALCQAAPKNITRFKDVLEYLKQDLQHESPAK